MYNTKNGGKDFEFFIVSIQLPGKAAHFYVADVKEISSYVDKLRELCIANKIDPECVQCSCGKALFESPNYATPFDELETQFYGQLGIPRVIIEKGVRK